MADKAKKAVQVLRRRSRNAPKTKKKVPAAAGSVGVKRAVDRLSETLAGIMEKGLSRIEIALDQMADRNMMLVIDESKIGAAVAKEISKQPAPKVEIPEREPVTYRATIERRGTQMVGALIEPVKGK
jgi:hypothetical protein